jgi:hypothetical protein
MPNVFMSPLDILQVRAFISIYRCHPELPKLERFCGSIVATSDDVFNKADPELVERWLREYSARNNRRLSGALPRNSA